MTHAQISAALTAWKQFFLTGEDAPSLDSLETLTALAHQSEDPQLHALAALCAMLEAAWTNGARHVEAEAA